MNLSFSRKTDLGLAALRELADAPELKLSRVDLADRIGTTSGFLAQVMPLLVAAGWVESDRGPGGGYRLTDAAYDARVIDVYRTIEGNAAYFRCVLRDGPCPETACEVHTVWSEARKVLIDGLEEIRVLQGERA